MPIGGGGGGGAPTADIEPVLAVDTAVVWPFRRARKLCKHFGHLI